MINDWFVRRSRVEALTSRVDALDRELADMRKALAMVADRVNAAERVAMDATDTLAASTRRVAGLRRATRAGAVRIRGALATIDASATDTDAIRGDIVRLQGTVTILAERVEDHAEQTRRAVTGLFERIGTIKADPG